jgi:hypothetical protein
MGPVVGLDNHTQHLETAPGRASEESLEIRDTHGHPARVYYPRVELDR